MRGREPDRRAEVDVAHAQGHLGHHQRQRHPSTRPHPRVGGVARERARHQQHRRQQVGAIAVQHLQAHQPLERREPATVAGRPVRADQARVVAAHDPAEQGLEVGEGGGPREDRQQPRRAARRRGCRAGLAEALGHQRVRQQAEEEQHRHRQVTAHHRGIEQLPHREGPEQHLGREQGHRQERQPAQARPQRAAGEGPAGERQDHHAHRQREQAMEPFDEHVELHGRDEAPLAERPVGTGEAGAGGAHHGAHDDAGEGEQRGGEAEARRDAEVAGRGQGDLSGPPSGQVPGVDAGIGHGIQGRMNGGRT